MCSYTIIFKLQKKSESLDDSWQIRFCIFWPTISSKMSISSHFLFFILVDKVTKNKKIGCVIFCTMFSVCKARQAKQKWKIIKKNTSYYVIFWFFITFVTQNGKQKMRWKAQNIQTGFLWVPYALHYNQGLYTF